MGGSEETVSFSQKQKHPANFSHTSRQCFSNMETLSSLLFLLLTVHSGMAFHSLACILDCQRAFMVNILQSILKEQFCNICLILWLNENPFAISKQW